MLKVDIFKYLDELNYLKDLKSLYEELKSVYESKEFVKAYAILKKVVKNNQSLIDELEKINMSNKDKNNKISVKNYEKKLVQDIPHNNDFIKKENDTELEFYIKYINSNDDYLEILPKVNDEESILILDKILIYYFNEINRCKSFIASSNESEVEFYNDYLAMECSIFESILKYKSELLTVDSVQNNQINLNELVYFMNDKDEIYAVDDIGNDPRDIVATLKLLEKMQKGIFKNVRAFVNDDKIKGIYEVRDLNAEVRVIFDILKSNKGKRKYCIIGVITDKTNTNSIYKKRLISRIKKYKESKKYQSDVSIKKLLIGG